MAKDLWFLTLAEQESVRAYDEQSQREIEAESHPPVRRDILQELKMALENESIHESAGRAKLDSDISGRAAL